MSILSITNATVPGRLEGVSLALPPGKLVGLVGPNGSGKSTLLQLAAGILPSPGAVAWDGRKLADIPVLERGRCATWVPQDAQFEFGFTVRSVVAQGRFAHGDDGRGVEEALESFKLSALGDRPVTRLSGGERARVLLARALATAAPLQLWDEPLAALDPRHALETLRLARDLALRGATILLSLHDLRAAHQLDLVVVLHEHRLRAFGIPNDVLTAELYLEVFGVRAAPAPGISFELP
jgi:iron complex transport system ATP-binding protein